MDAADRQRVAELAADMPPPPDDVLDRIALALDVTDRADQKAA